MVTFYRPPTAMPAKPQAKTVDLGAGGLSAEEVLSSEWYYAEHCRQERVRVSELHVTNICVWVTLDVYMYMYM